MTKNRLQLDFSLETTNERNEFVQKYLKNEIFKNKPPTSSELETLSNYILWGKGENGKNVVQDKIIEIDTRHSTWNKQKNESIEGLLENPAFDENLLVPIGAEAPLRKKRQVFNRNSILKDETCAPTKKEAFKALFKQIDDADLLITFYEMDHGKRKKPPREELLKKFTDEEVEKIQKRAAALTSYEYLKWRHHVVDLRTTQYVLNDSAQLPNMSETKYHLRFSEMALSLDGNCDFFPLGLKNDGAISHLVFITEKDFERVDYDSAALQKISTFYWRQLDAKEKKEGFYFDFSDVEHLYQFFLLLPDIEQEILSTYSPRGGILREILDTFNFYVELANLNEIHADLLEMKRQQKKNHDIAVFLNKKYGKSYTENYISTLFKQKILKQIAEAALFHQELVGNFFFRENFRYCTTCGRYLLKSPKNFVRKSRAKDGYCGRCKECDKKMRAMRKEKKDG